MSFSSDVKEELVEVTGKARHCELAELAAILSMTGRIKSGEDGTCTLRICAENPRVVEKAQSLIRKVFSVDVAILEKENRYELSIAKQEIAVKILQATKIMDAQGFVNEDLSLVNSMGIVNSCCKRAFLRGAFYSGGSISDPEKSYHLEIVTGSRHKAEQLAEAMRPFELDAHIVERRRSFVVYLKEGAQIVDMLNVMGAHKSLMDLENVRILKEMRNTINRQCNCDNANSDKAAVAGVKQAKDARYIEETVGLGVLNEGLQEIARLRIEYPSMPLKELGELLDPPVGKSGVNHRLRKISEFAEDLRQKSAK